MDAPADILPPLTEAQFRSLRERIREAGRILSPVLKTPDGRTIDGRNRERIAVELVIECPVTVVEGTEKDYVELAIENNRGSRQLTRAQREEYAMRLFRDHQSSAQSIEHLTGVDHRRLRKLLDHEELHNEATASKYKSPKPTLTSIRQAARRVKVEEARSRGLNQAQIVKELKLNPRTVAKDLAEIEPPKPKLSKRQPKSKPEPEPEPDSWWHRSLGTEFLRHTLFEARKMSAVAVIARDAVAAFDANDEAWVKETRDLIEEWMTFGQRMTESLLDIDKARHFAGYAGIR
jgi:hypothetical protein